MSDVRHRTWQDDPRPPNPRPPRDTGVRRALATAASVELRVMLALAVVGGGATCARHRPAERQQRAPHPDRFIETVRARAPFDLSCSAEQVTIIQLGETTLGARGCGRQTSYACVCTYHVWNTCTQAVCSLDGAAVGNPVPDAAPSVQRLGKETTTIE